LKIVADENIPFVREAFGSLGQVETLPGRRINPEAVADAEALLVRSVTKVDSTLLEGSKVRFVGTATIGTDHVDGDYLSEREIAFAAAPGSNAASVAEYVFAALLMLAEREGFRLHDMSVGVVGVGNVGSRVAARAEALGMDVLLNDPPLSRETGDPKYLPIERILSADIVTIHVPLTYGGEDPTYQMVNEGFIDGMKSGAILINTSRGKVAESRALKRALDWDQLGEVILDVWENEPRPDPSLIERAAIATPHIAGYALDGKVRGTEMIYQAACEHFDADPTWRMEKALGPPEIPELTLKTKGRHEEDVVREAVTAVYDIKADDARMRQMLKYPPAERPRAFDRMRREYPPRREFHNTTLTLDPPTDSLRAKLEALGFRVK